MTLKAEDAEKTAASKETSLVHVYIGEQLKTVQMDREHVLCEQPCTPHTKMDCCILACFEPFFFFFYIFNTFNFI